MAKSGWFAVDYAKSDRLLDDEYSVDYIFFAGGVSRESMNSSAWMNFRVNVRGNRVSAAISENAELGKWVTMDLAEISIGAGEPSFETELWQRENKS